MASAQYFSHDSNARNDEKILALRMKHGWEGYGLYWAIVERLRDSKGYRLSTNFNLLAYDLRTTNELIKSIVSGFGLFTIDGEEFYSESLCNRMSLKDEASERAREKALKRWSKEAPASSENDGAVQKECSGNATAMQQHSAGNAIKVKESKESKVGVYVGGAGGENAAGAATHPQAVSSLQSPSIPPTPDESPPKDPALIQRWQKFHDWVGKHAPRLLKLKEPISLDQFTKLDEAWATDEALKRLQFRLLQEMHNHKDITKKISAYLTLLTWTRNEQKKTR